MVTIPVLDFSLPEGVSASAVEGGVVTVAPRLVTVVQGAGRTALTREAALALLLANGWPADVAVEGVRVACGPGRVWNRAIEAWVDAPNGESGCRPGAVGDTGRSGGLFQLNFETWSRYCGVEPEALLDAGVNAACALRVYGYDVGRGQEPWNQWSVKP